MIWEILIIRVVDGIEICPPMNFDAELEWMKSAVCLGQIHKYVIDPNMSSSSDAIAHPIQFIKLEKLKNRDHQIAWMIIQEMGKFGWETYSMYGSPWFPYSTRFSEFGVFMRRQLG